MSTARELSAVELGEELKTLLWPQLESPRKAFELIAALVSLAQPGEGALTGWQSIETAPKDGTDVLVMYMHIDTQVVHNAFWMDDEDDPGASGWWSYDKSEVSRILLDDWMTPAHWMPLPPPPGITSTPTGDSA